MMLQPVTAPAQQEDPQVDKKAKTPKKPKTAKPKGTTKTA
jgi:hypothetical protein